MKNIIIHFLAVASVFLTIIFVSMFFVPRDKKPTILINTNKESPVSAIGGDETQERIYLRFGAIYALKDDPKKEYDVIDTAIIHVTSERLKDFIFFDTPEEAEAAGYKPSKDFARAYKCVKQGKDSFECD